MKNASGKACDLDLNSGSMSWMRLGQIYDLTGRRTAVTVCRKAVAMAPQSEVGNESRHYLTQAYKRNVPAETAQEDKN